MDDSDESDSDSDEDDPLVSGQIRISVHILPEIKSEQVELPLEEDLDSGEIEADPAWRVDVQRRCVTIECCQYEVAGDFECVYDAPEKSVCVNFHQVSQLPTVEQSPTSP